jgi:hypothetical protein
VRNALAALSDPRGRWLWARAHAARLPSSLPFHRNRISARETFRPLLCRFALSVLIETCTGWPTAVRAERISQDETVLRGSKRDCAAPLLVVAAFGHRLGLVLRPVVADGQDKTEAAIALLERVPRAGKLFPWMQG